MWASTFGVVSGRPAMGLGFDQKQSTRLLCWILPAQPKRCRRCARDLRPPGTGQSGRGRRQPAGRPGRRKRLVGEFADHDPPLRRTAYEGHVARRKRQPRGPGRPPLPELTLTAPKTTPITPEQRAQFVALLTDMIVKYRQEQHLERARAAASRTHVHPPEEPPGHSPGP